MYTPHNYINLVFRTHIKCDIYIKTKTKIIEWISKISRITLLLRTNINVYLNNKHFSINYADDYHFNINVDNEHSDVLIINILI